jgi:hypothetical protein
VFIVCVWASFGVPVIAVEHSEAMPILIDRELVLRRSPRGSDLCKLRWRLRLGGRVE